MGCHVYSSDLKSFLGTQVLELDWTPVGTHQAAHQSLRCPVPGPQGGSWRSTVESRASVGHGRGPMKMPSAPRGGQFSHFKGVPSFQVTTHVGESQGFFWDALS